MSKFKIATLAQGVAGLRNLSELVSGDPFPAEFQDYSEVVGTDLNGAPVTAGLPRAKWTWEWLPQFEIDRLLTYCPSDNASVYIRTETMYGTKRKFKIYQATMLKPALGDIELSLHGEPALPQHRGPVEIQFVNLVLQP